MTWNCKWYENDSNVKDNKKNTSDIKVTCEEHKIDIINWHESYFKITE